MVKNTVKPLDYTRLKRYYKHMETRKAQFQHPTHKDKIMNFPQQFPVLITAEQVKRILPETSNGQEMSVEAIEAVLEKAIEGSEEENPIIITNLSDLFLGAYEYKPSEAFKEFGKSAYKDAIAEIVYNVISEDEKFQADLVKIDNDFDNDSSESFLAKYMTADNLDNVDGLASELMDYVEAEDLIKLSNGNYLFC